jgi:hypothetical protein
MGAKNIVTNALIIAEHKIDQHLQGQYNQPPYPALGVALRVIRKALLEVDKLKDDMENKWIPVTERLPELTLSTPDVKYSERVLIQIKRVCDPKTRIIIGDLNKWRDDPVPGWNTDSGTPVDGVIAWQPLPEPMKEQQ